MAGPRLASVDSERSLLLDTLFSSLLGTNLSLSVLDWNALAMGELNLAATLNALALELGVSSAETALVSSTQLLELATAAAAVAEADGNTALVTALNALELPLAGLSDTVVLGDLLQLAFPQGALSDIDLNVLDLLTGAVQLYNYDNVLTTPSPVTLDGSALSTLGLTGVFNTVELYLQVVEPPVYSCGPVGTTFHTAAIRSKANVDLVDQMLGTSALETVLETVLPGTTVSVEASLAQVQLYTELARAEGTLSAVDALTGAVSVEATPGVVDLYLGDISDVLFFNRSYLIDPTTDVQLGDIGSLTITVDQPLLPDITETTSLRARSSGQGEAPVASSLEFFLYPATQTVSTSATFIDTLLSDVVTRLELELGGSLGTLLDPLVNGTILPALRTLTQDALSPLLETLLTTVIDPVLALLGIRLGEVDVTVLGRAALCSDGSITLRLDLFPDDPTDFVLRATGSGVSNTLLDDDTDPTLSNQVGFSGLGEGSYVFELLPGAGWMLSDLSCTEAGGGSLSRIVYGPDGPFIAGDTDVRIELRRNETLECSFLVEADSDGDLLPDRLDPRPEAIDPQGFIYDEVTGEIIPGGMISVVDESGSDSNVNLISDGSTTGEYQFTVTTPGTYTVSLTPPDGYALSSVCVAQTAAYDATPTPNPNTIGSSGDGTRLQDARCSANPYYVAFRLDEGDALVINNNYPLVPAAAISKAFTPALVRVDRPSTLTLTLSNTGTNAVDLTNVTLTDAFPVGLVVAEAPNASTTCNGGSLSAAAGDIRLELVGANVPAGATCQVTVDLLSSAAGNYANVIPAAALDNDQNVNANADTSAVLEVFPIEIRGTVFYDDGLGGGTAHDALQGGAERPVAGVQVSATDGTLTLKTLTDAQGAYVFDARDLLGDVTLSHTLQAATGSSLGAHSAVCLATGYGDLSVANRVIGDTDCSGSVDGAEAGFDPTRSYDGYDFGIVRPSQLISDRSGQARSPGVVEYDHLYTPGTLGSVTLNATGLYSYQVFIDKNCDGSYASEGPYSLPYNLSVDGTWSRLSDGSLQPCAIKVRVIIPDGEVSGTADTVRLGASLEWQSNPAVLDNRFVTDTTVIIEGGRLELIKEVRNLTQGSAFASTGTGAPGELLEYRISYTNRGSDVVTAVKFSDPVPPFTKIEPNQYGTSGEVELICPDASVKSLDTGVVNRVDIDIMTECALLQIRSGEGGTVSYRVKIR